MRKTEFRGTPSKSCVKVREFDGRTEHESKRHVPNPRAAPYSPDDSQRKALARRPF